MSTPVSLRHSSARDVDRLGKTSRSPILHISYNYSGTRVVHTREDASIRVYKSTASGILDPVIIDNAHSKPVTSIAWLPLTDTTFASVGGDSVVKIWRGNGALEREVVVDASGAAKCRLVSFSPDGVIMLVATASGSIEAFNALENYSRIASFSVAEHENAVDEPNLVTDIKWANRGHEYFFVGLKTGPILVFGYENRQLSVISPLLGCRSVTCLLIDPRGTFLAAGSTDGIVSFWSTSDMVNYKALTSVDQEVSALCASRDGSLLCVAYKSGSTTRVFDTDTLDEVHEIADTMAGETASLAAWSPSKYEFVYSKDKGLVLGHARREEIREDAKEEKRPERTEKRDERKDDRRGDRDRRDDRRDFRRNGGRDDRRDRRGDDRRRR